MNTYEMLEEAAHRAYTRGIQTGNGGNLSARADFGMIVKSSGGSFADCLADGTGFVETDLDGSVLSPSGKPTREVVLHGLMYKLCPECGGVMHCHSPWSVAWAYSHDVLPMTTPWSWAYSTTLRVRAMLSSKLWEEPSIMTEVKPPSMQLLQVSKSGP